MKRIIATIMAPVICLAFIVACNSSDTKNTPPDTEAKSQTKQMATAIPAKDGAFRVTAKGHQIYQCVDSGGRFAWKFIGPHAILNDASGYEIGHHEKSPNGPIWQHKDGSIVTGSRLGGAVAPGSTDIDWLILKGDESKGSGQLNGVHRILRVETKDGKAASAPLTAADLNRIDSVYYTATYYFFKGTQ